MGDVIGLTAAVVGGMLALIGGLMWLVKWSDDDQPARGLRARSKRLEAENAVLRSLVASLHARAVRGRDVDPVSAVFADEIEAVMRTEVTFTAK